MRTYSSPIGGTCGLGLWYGFNSDVGDYYSYRLENARMGGIGYSVAGFVNTPRCEDVYNWIKENKEIVFQSPVKKNRNSGRKFFFIVFKNKEAA